MVRPHSGSPRSKHRPFSDGYNSMNNEGRFGSPSRSQRGFRGKAPPSWREGPKPYSKRPVLGDRRDRPQGQWMQNHNQFHPYSHDSQRGRRRLSPDRSGRPVQHRHSPHGPAHGSPSHRVPLFHHRTSPPRHFHGPSDRRIPSPHGSFRGAQRRPSPHHERNWGPQPLDRPFGRPPPRGHHWNGPRGYQHPPRGDSRPFGTPLRKPREFQGRSSYPERWSADRDGGFGRDFGRPGTEWAQRGRGRGSLSFRPLFRSPAQRPGPTSSLRPYPLLRLTDRPVKRMNPDFRHSGPDEGPAKRFRREWSARPLRGFGGRGLSLSDKSRLIKARKFREESVSRFKLPPPRPRISERVQSKSTSQNSKDSSSSRESSPTDSKTADADGDSDTNVESRRSVSKHSSSPIDRRLSRDLVVVSHWESGRKPSTSPKNSAPWRNRAPKSLSESSDSLTLNERFTKLQSPNSSKELRELRSSGSPKVLRKPDSFQRAPPDGITRKPLMATLIPRPSFNQKPVFKKSQSIMSKYKNLQTLRHKVPQQRQATSYRRW